MVPIHHTFLTKSLLQNFLEMALRQHEQKGKITAELGKVDFCTTRLAIIESNLRNAAAMLEESRTQAEPLQQLEAGRMKRASITASGSALLRINDLKVNPAFDEQNTRQ